MGPLVLIGVHGDKNFGRATRGRHPKDAPPVTETFLRLPLDQKPTH